jgi:hypothetical protein
MKDAFRPRRKHRIDQEKIDEIMYPFVWTAKRDDILRKVGGLGSYNQVNRFHHNIASFRYITLF